MIVLIKKFKKFILLLVNDSPMYPEEVCIINNVSPNTHHMLRFLRRNRLGIIFCLVFFICNYSCLPFSTKVFLFLICNFYIHLDFQSISPNGHLMHLFYWICISVTILLIFSVYFYYKWFHSRNSVRFQMLLKKWVTLNHVQPK